MKTLTLFFCLTMTLFSRATPVHTITKKNVIHISAADGLPCNNISMTLQDTNGYLWIGTANGLSRYDGYRFINFVGNGNGLSYYQTNRINTMYPDWQSGLLWVTSGKGHTGCFDTKLQQFVDFTGCNRYEDLYWGLLPGKGYCWQYSGEIGARLIRKTRKGFSMSEYNVKNGLLPSNYVINVKVSTDGSNWLHTSDGVVKIGKDGRKSFQINGNDFLCINTFGTSCLLLSAQKGFIEIKNNGKQITRCQQPLGLTTADKISRSIIFNDKWFILSKKSLIIYDIKNNSVVPSNNDALVSKAKIVGKNKSAVFFSNDNGTLYRYSKEGKLTTLNLIPHYILKYTRKDHFHIATTRDGQEFISTYGNGLFIYTPATGQLIHHTQKEGLINDDFLVNIMIDNAGRVWITNDHTGISCLKPADIKFKLIRPEMSQSMPESNSIKAFTQGIDGSLIASNMRGNTYAINLNSGESSINGNYSHKVYSMLTDRYGRTWIGMRGGGLALIGKGAVKNFPCADVYDIMEGKDGRLWLATSDGLVLMHVNNNNRIKFEHYLRGVFMHDLEADKAGNIWMATENGLFIVEAQKPKRIFLFNKKRGNFPSNDIICLRNSSFGMTVGTAGNGMIICSLRRNKLKYHSITTHNGLTSNIVNSIEKDNFGHLWVASEEGLSCIANKGQTVRKLYFTDDILGNSYNENASMVLRNGDIAFGSRNGIILINPKDLPKTEQRHNIAITSIYVNGQLRQGLIENEQEIELKYNQNTLAIWFSNFMFTDVKSSNYTYFMEGADKNWSRPVNNNSVVYANLPSGRYIFHVKNMGESAQGKEATLTIIIRQPWWNSILAWIIYTIIALSVLIIWLTVSGRIRSMKLRMQIERRITEVKLNFFTNIANELRTPLTLIYGAAERLRTDHNGISRSTMQTLRNGTHRLMRTANQLSLFRELNLGQVHLYVGKADIVRFIYNLYDEYSSIAFNQGIRFVFTPFAQTFIMPFDKEKLELIICGILSNAVSSTQKNGSIIIKLKHDTKAGMVTFTIENKGANATIPDFPAEESKPTTITGHESYTEGIGLYISKQMAIIHHGEMTYSKMDAQTQLYTVNLPCTDKAYAPKEWGVKKESDMDKTSLPTAVDMDLQGNPFNDKTVMIIENDHDIASMMANTLSRYFRVKTAENTFTPEEIIKKEHPNVLIIDTSNSNNADIYASVHRIKTENMISSTAIILLTNSDDVADIIKAIGCGADEVLSKPFSQQVLVAIVIKQIKLAQNSSNNDKRADRTTTHPHTYTPAVITNNIDMRFKREFELRLAQNISDPSFSVGNFATQMHYGTTQFHKKVKELTGLTPLEHIRRERMNYVAKLLDETRMTVDEIREKVGYSSSTNFHNHFKQQFGCSPAQYRKRDSGFV